MKNIFESENIKYNNQNGIEYIQFKKLLQYPEIVHCYTLRSLDKLNFPPIYKDETMLKQSYKKICNCLHLDETSIVKPHQTHTKNVQIVEDIIELKDVDGIITNKNGLTLLTTSADCTSLLFYDPVKKVIADVHSGWRGTLQGISKATVEKMISKYGCNSKDIICCICPCIKQCCFEVEDDVKNLFEKEYGYLENINDIIKYGSKVKENDKNKKQKYYIDTTEINKQLLLNAGLKLENIIDSNICTKCNSEYFHSYRADGEKSGRNAAVICLIGDGS